MKTNRAGQRFSDTVAMIGRPSDPQVVGLVQSRVRARRHSSARLISLGDCESVHRVAAQWRTPSLREPHGIPKCNVSRFNRYPTASTNRTRRACRWVAVATAQAEKLCDVLIFAMVMYVRGRRDHHGGEDAAPTRQQSDMMHTAC